MRILVVEDDKKIASFVVNGLKQAGFVAEHKQTTVKPGSISR